MAEAYSRNGAWVTVVTNNNGARMLRGRPVTLCILPYSNATPLCAAKSRILEVLGVIRLILRNGPFDAIVVPTKGPDELLPAYATSRLLHIPIVVIPHHTQARKSNPITGLFLKHRQYHTLESFALEVASDLSNLLVAHADLIFVFGETWKWEFCRRLGINPSKIRETSNGVSVPEPPERPSDRGRFDGVYVGRLSNIKGTDTLMLAWKEVCKTLPQAKLAVIGGSSKDVERYRELAMKASVSNNVFFLGYIDRDDLIQTLRASTVFVFPSKMEGFALAVAEAMACGLPCVISDIPVFREFYSDAAFLADKDSPSDFASKILVLLRNPSLREKYAKLSLSLSNRYSWNEIARREIAFISELSLGKFGGSSE
jgi:glycosyltransferase involved in cell wall biosynthesis